MQGSEVAADGFDIDIKRSPHAKRISKDISIAELMSDTAISNAEDEGFERLSEEKLRRSVGGNFDEIIQALSKKVPFGAQASTVRAMVNPKVTVLVKTEGARCNAGGRGAIGVFLIRSSGDPLVAADFGSMMFYVMGLGSCGRAGGESMKYVRNLTAETKRVVLQRIDN